MEIRALQNENQEKVIEGYFVKYNVTTDLSSDLHEVIESNSFTKTLANDNIRCLFNHNTDEVLGTTKNGTLKLRSDEIGLWGQVKINENDTLAMNIYERVKRGDIDGCSFGFEPQVYDFERSTNTFILREAKLFEVSICTFPQYTQTEIYARLKADDFKKRKLEVLAKIKKNQGG